MFALDSRLQQDTLPIGDFPLCRLLLMNDAHYPWFILVPRREDVTELFQLDAEDQKAFWQETTELAESLKDTFGADKMNVITSYSIHYTKLYDATLRPCPSAAEKAGPQALDRALGSVGVLA